MERQQKAFRKNIQTPPEKPIDNPQVLKMHHISSDILTSQEEITYIAIQRKPLTGKSPDAIVFTDKRFILYRPKLFGGAFFADHTWAELKNVELEEGIMGSTLSLTTADEKRLSIDYLPKAQARKLYSLAREMQEVQNEKRACEIEAIIRCNQKNQAKPAAKAKNTSKTNPARRILKQTAPSGC